MRPVADSLLLDDGLNDLQSPVLLSLRPNCAERASPLPEDVCEAESAAPLEALFSSLLEASLPEAAVPAFGLAEDAADAE